MGYRVGRIELATDFDAQVCRGTLLDLDAHMAFVEDALARPTSDEPLRIYWLDDDVAEWCGDDHSGCFFPGTGVMVANEQALTHEIVHAVLATPDADPFLEEGLAERLGGGAVSYDPRAHEVALDDALSAGRPPGSTLGYDAAHHFVAWLEDRVGPDIFPTLAGLAARGAEGEALRTGIADALGEHYALLLDDYEATAPELFPGTRESAIERIGLRQLGEGVELELDCTADDTRGPWRDGGSYRVLALASEHDAELELELGGEPGTHVRIFDPDASARWGLTTQWRIPDPDVDPDAIAIDVGERRRVELDGGRTYLVVFVADASPARAVLRCPSCPKTPSSGH